MGRIIGIDLGTTTSGVAYIKNGKPEIIVNNLGARITPSVVGLTDDNEVIVGSLAKTQITLKPERTVCEVKRLIGTNKKVVMGDKEYLPQEISALLLKELKRYAEEELQDSVTEAVITVPANFDDLQKKATKEAGELAGLVVNRIINEPTAAALAYGIDNMDDESKILVYDLGGGTFDVTVLEMYDGILEVKASRGNNKLGGKDFDERISELILKDFLEKNSVDLNGNSRAMARIKEAAERAKIELSSMNSTQIDIPFIGMDKEGNPLEVSIKLYREEFEELINPLIESTRIEIDDALNAVGYRYEDIDVVLTVGGSSRIPQVKHLLNTLFEGKLKGGVNPDEAVTLGAAVQAGIKNEEITGENSILITDVCRYTLGTSVVVGNGHGSYIDGVFDPLILKDTTIPATVKKVYYTANDNQTAVCVDVYQGDGKFVSENIKIGEFELDGIPEDEAGVEGIEISFAYNLNGILEIGAKVISNGKSITGIIDTQKTSVIEESVFVDSNTVEGSWENTPLADDVRNTIELAERKLCDLTGNNKENISKMLEELKAALINNDEKLVSNLDDKLTDVLFELL